MDGVPPGILFTLQVTLVSAVFVTVAVRVCEFPRRTDPVVGDTVTVTDGGGGADGGGDMTDAGPPPQPNNHSAAKEACASPRARARRACLDRWLAFIFTELCVRGRMLGRNAGEGPAKGARPMSSHADHLGLCWPRLTA
jgi:hypothetical protein